ncbi:MAG: transposase [Peptostreptococcaceae bacterium]|nr:transposase [Peptostreptococcaceae bacterium]
MEEKIKELTLMLLYLTSWKESECGMIYDRSWKGYNFELLKKLSDEDLIIDSKKSKSVAITNEGIAKAKQLLDLYGLKE